jgi:hypothetical protein
VNQAAWISTRAWSTSCSPTASSRCSTLFHWDLPAALDDRGGWLNPDIADWFADYGSVMYRALDGRVKKWVTLNEPWVVTDGGYLHGALAPGHRSRYEAPIASHNLMRAHGSAVQAYRAIGKHEIGLVVNIEPKYPATDSAPTPSGAPRARLHERAVPRSRAARRLSAGAEGNLRRRLAGMAGRGHALIKQTLDFIGINYYTRSVTAASDSYPLKASAVKQPLRHLHRDRLGSVPAGPGRPAGVGEGPLRQRAGLTSTEKRRGPSSIPPIRRPVDAAGQPPRTRPAADGWTPLRKHLSAIHDAIRAGRSTIRRLHCSGRSSTTSSESVGDYLPRACGGGGALVHVQLRHPGSRTPKDSARGISEGDPQRHGPQAWPIRCPTELVADGCPRLPPSSAAGSLPGLFSRHRPGD